MSTPDYRVEVSGWGTNFGVGSKVAVFENARNIGIQDLVNDVPQAFFTVQQSDSRLPAVATLAQTGDGHMRIYRGDDLLFGGFFAQEIDEREGDVVVYAYGYLAALYWQAMAWAQEYDNQTVGAIVTDIWTSAKAQTDSMLAWTTTGTIESPVTTSGGGTPITMPLYSAPYKRRLFALRELAAYSQSDTTNRVWFEITPSGTFNFWKNKGTDQNAQSLVWPGQNVLGFHRYRMPVDRRNALLGVGSTPRDIALRDETHTDTSDSSAHGLRQEPLYYKWVRDSDELSRVQGLRLKKALRGDNNLVLTLAPNSIPPLGATGGWNRMDSVNVTITRGITQMVHEQKLITGQQVLWVNNREYVRLALQDKPS